MNGFANPRIRSAAAHVAAHRAVDISVAWLRRRGQERSGRHDLAGLAIAALRDLFLNPCFAVRGDTHSLKDLR